MKQKIDIIKDISLLYELSLAVGKSLHLEENCDIFLKKLISRKGLSFASVWLRGNVLQENPDHAFLVYAHPDFKATTRQIARDHALFSRIAEKPYFSVRSTDPDFQEYVLEDIVQEGSIAVFKLGDIGFLKLYASTRDEMFTQVERNQLYHVVEKFTVSLEGCISYNQYKVELREKTLFSATIRSIMHSALDGMILTDQEGVITDWNPQAEIIFGWKKQEIIGKKLAETIIPLQYRDAHAAGMKRFSSTGKGHILNQRIEITGLHRKGHEFPIELSIVPIKSQNGYIFSGFVRDITLQKLQEEKRETLLKKLEAVNRELNDFAYIVSHDLKAPLRAISSLAAWLNEDYKDAIDEMGQEQLSLLINRVDRMNNLINGILNYSRIGRMNTETENVDLNNLIRDSLLLLSVPEHIQVAVQPDLPVIQTNPVSIQQVFQNLISNAIKYHDKPSGTIEIGYREVEKKHLFWVKDDGQGIDEKYFDKIFKMFQTLKPKDQVEATGIGLSIVKKVLSIYNGEIWVESTPGEGSTFFFTLPRETDMKALDS